MKGEIATVTTEIQRILRNYYKQLYANKSENLGKMDKSLEKYNLPKLNEGERESLNTPATADKTEGLIKKLPTNKSPTNKSQTDGFTGEFHKAFKEKLTPILNRLFQKSQLPGRLPKLFL